MGSAQTPAHEDGKGGSGFLSRALIRESVYQWKEAFEGTEPVWTSMVAQTVKCLPTMWDTRFQSLGREDPLEKEMATHSNTFAWKIPWTEEPGRLQSTGSQRVGQDWATSLSLSSQSETSKQKSFESDVSLFASAP